MILESAINPAAKQEVDQTHQAARVSLRPHEFRGPNNAHIGGHFRTILSTGATTGLAAGAPMLSMRWTNPDRAFLLNRLRAWATIGTAFTTAQEIAVDMARVNNFTAPDTGGTLIELGEFARKERSHMRGSALANLRVCGAGALTPGTGTEETPPNGGSLFPGLLNVVGSMAEARVFDMAQGTEHPFVLGNLEGLRVRNRVAQGAVGVVVFTFEFDWVEAPTSMLGA